MKKILFFLLIWFSSFVVFAQKNVVEFDDLKSYIGSHVDSVQHKMNPIKEMISDSSTNVYYYMSSINLSLLETYKATLFLFYKNENKEIYAQKILIPMTGKISPDDQYSVICDYFMDEIPVIAEVPGNYYKYFGKDFYRQFAISKVLINDTLYTQILFGHDIYSDSFFNSILENYKSKYMINSLQPDKQEVDTYKLYPTKNMYNFIRLNTVNGKMDLVQWAVNNNQEFIYSLNTESLLSSVDKPIVGRYKLEPTTNVYAFLLIDTINGYTWHVQWGFEANKRFVQRIY